MMKQIFYFLCLILVNIIQKHAFAFKSSKVFLTNDIDPTVKLSRQQLDKQIQNKAQKMREHHISNRERRQEERLMIHKKHQETQRQKLYMMKVRKKKIKKEKEQRENNEQPILAEIQKKPIAKIMPHLVKLRNKQLKQKLRQEKWEKRKEQIADLSKIKDAKLRQQYVKNALEHAWSGYADRCFGMDEYDPVSNSCENWLGAGLTLIDTLDTLKLMGYENDFKKARDWVERNLELTSTKKISFFETVIRIVGGLLSAYDLSGDYMFVDKAKAIADILDRAFDSKTGIPARDIVPSPVPSIGKSMKFMKSAVTSLSDIGTIQLEYFTLSHHLNNNSYQEKAQRIIDYLYSQKTSSGLYPIIINYEKGYFGTSMFSFGGGGDSFYEYLQKMWLLTGRSKKQYQEMYINSIQGMIKYLLERNEDGMLYLPWLDAKSGKKSTTMHHLTCFVPSMLALGSVSGILPSVVMERNHLKIAKELCYSCYMMYNSTLSGLGSEEASFESNHGIQSRNHIYSLRPETIESIFYLWRITGDNMYRDWGWKIFLAIELNCKMKSGYSGIKHVNASTRRHIGKQESFFLAETLKYMWLLFQNRSVLPLAGIDDQRGSIKDIFYVFNTEAHPLKVFYPKT